MYHNAGLGGTGGSSYIDAVVLRNRDAGTSGGGWDDAGDGVLEERRVYCQNWRGDVVALLTDTGKLVEQVRYTPYGVPTCLPAGDTDSDGDWDATDSAAIGGAYDVREDADLDGNNNANDVTQANSVTGGYQTLGRLMLSSTSIRSRKGYASYEHDAAGALDHVVAHVRYRVLRLDLGRWIQRDPAGYALYQYELQSFIQLKPYQPPSEEMQDCYMDPLAPGCFDMIIVRCRSILPVTPCWGFLGPGQGGITFDLVIECAQDAIFFKNACPDPNIGRHCLFSCCLFSNPFIPDDKVWHFLEIRECCTLYNNNWMGWKHYKDVSEDWLGNLLGETCSGPAPSYDEALWSCLQCCDCLAQD